MVFVVWYNSLLHRKCNTTNTTGNGKESSKGNNEISECKEN